ncbi:MAG: exopolyphosphatase-related protein [uncultured archaeon A07HB70]|nr:MAG: exopolyphosphatase-related protein [uncultured archaeon A07HB70]
MQVPWGGVRDVVDAARANPEAVAAAFGVLLVVALGGYGLLRYRRPPGVRLRRLLDELDEVVVLTHPTPDPDAMASAMGVGTLAEQVGADVTLQYSGSIRHQENRAFRTVLDLEMDHVEDVSDLAAEAVVLVDHNEPRGFEGDDGVEPVAVVDHHPGSGGGEAFTDVRTDYGAAASIVAEHLSDVGAVPVPPDQHASEADADFTVPSGVATGLLYGLLSDTDRLTNGASAADFDAASYLYPGVDDELLNRIANPQVGSDVLETKARAIAGREVRGSFAVSDVGSIENVDAIPQAADELMRLEGVTAVVVCGECDGVVRLSGRSRDDRVHMGRIIGSLADGCPGGSGGGHSRMGAGQIPVARTDGDGGISEPERTDLADRVFDALNGEG